jgi:hypothetical protein
MGKKRIDQEQPDQFLDDTGIMTARDVPKTCISCSRLVDMNLRRCQAFKVIPDPIWNGKVRHRQPYAGDGGLQWKKITQEELDEQLKEAKSLLT